MSRKRHMHSAAARDDRVGKRRGKPGSTRSAGKKRRRSRWRSAATSDKLDLYERSVQEPAAECNFIEQVWKEQRPVGRRPRSIREDFCGTAIVCMEWVKRHRRNTAAGVDLDANVLNWARQRMNKRLKASQISRLRLVQDDVRSAAVRHVDSVLAMNFSHFVFKTRPELRRYYKSVHRSLTRDGIFILDAYGGSESYEEMQEERDLDGFTYVWDQRLYNPIDNHVVNHIHFKFPDGTGISNAFSYDWRLWSLPEIQEILLEAGFRRVHVYWEGTDEKTGEGDGVWRASTEGEACAGWIAYIVALK